MQASVKESLSKVDSIVRQYEGQAGTAIPILQSIQDELGHVSPVFLQRVSELTAIPASDLYGIVTFYSQFRLEPLGKHHVQICHGSACHLAGAERITDAIEFETKTKCGCTGADGQFTVEKVACLGCCSLAPVVNIDGEVHGKLSAEKIKQVIEDTKGSEVVHHGR